MELNPSTSIFARQHPSTGPSHSYIHAFSADVVQSVPLAAEPGISLIILPLMMILQRNLKRTYLIV